ncbi:hypothetical protein ACIQU4_28680 [Streptomyces sp. NPDC090741]|uniref:hypothetical protein n=1 Tax=Streptomyces sp. NPDC090741 TaxID=3365967 RepID=UPI003822A039
MTQRMLADPVAHAVARGHGENHYETKCRLAGWRGHAMPQDLKSLDDLRGVMQDGYTPEDVNRVFSRIEETCGLSLMCVWEMCDAFGFGGNSEFYVQAPTGDLHALVGDLWAWLNGDPQDAANPDAPGAPESWIGARAAVAEPACDDGFCNVALACECAPDGSL